VPPGRARIIDVSRPLAADTVCWPGDTPFAFRLGWRIADGASVNVGAVETSVHTATHCDAPFHYDDRGRTVEQLPPETFVGPAWVADVRGVVEWRSRLDGADLAETPRVLFRTGGWPDTRRFPDSIPVMEPDLPAWLGARGVVLVGVDLPSVDHLDSKTLDNHHALGRAGVTILEGLWLDVPEGRYELLALPLKLVGADGAPLRAVLRSEPEPPG
jgi:arylformamidase